MAIEIKKELNSKKLVSEIETEYGIQFFTSYVTSTSFADSVEGSDVLDESTDHGMTDMECENSNHTDSGRAYSKQEVVCIANGNYIQVIQIEKVLSLESDREIF